MATPAAILSVLVRADGVTRATRDIRGLDKDLGRVDKSGRKTTSMFATLGKVAGGVVAFETLRRGVGAAVSEFEEARKVGAQTTNVIKTTGGAANVTAKQVANLAGAISRKVGIDDEAIQSGANLILTFKNVRNEVGAGNKVFDRATKAAVDLSAAGFGDLTATSKQLGKALNDPVKGLTALGRAGVTFTEQQKKKIESLVEEGKVLKAQKVILKEVESQVKGSAAAQVTALDHLKVTFGNLAEAAGQVLVPAVDRGARALDGFLRDAMEGRNVGGALVSTFKSVGGALGDLINGFRDGAGPARAFAAGLAAVAAAFVTLRVVGSVTAGIKALKDAWAALNVAIARNPIGLVAAALGALAAAFGVMQIKTRDAAAASRDHADALRAEEQALRDVRDIDIDIAQRRANVQSATVAVAQAEKNYTAAVKEHGRKSLEAKQAAADLNQARVSLRRSTRELGDAESDAAEKRRVATEATKRSREEGERKIGVLQRELEKTEGSIRVLIRQGTAYGENADKVRKLRERSESLREEIARLESKNVTVGVKFTLNPAPQAAGPGGQMRPGDGWGVESSLQKLAQSAVDTGKLVPGLGSTPIGGTGLNAFNALAMSYGLTVGSGFRAGSITSSGNLSYHAMGRARDFPGPAGAMLAFAQFMAATFGGRLKELIHTPLGFSIKNGARVAPYAQADHYDHVHVAMRRGGKVPGQGVGDRVPALLEPGEFVVRKKIVDHFGPTFFAGLNGMKKGGRVGKNTKKTMEAIAAAARGSRRMPFIEQAGALAALTEDLADDIAAADELVRFWEGQLRIAFASGRGITAAAQGLKGARDARAGLTPASVSAGGAGNDNAAAILELAAAIDRQVKFNEWMIKTQGPSIVNAVVAAVNGGIGGPVGLGFQGIRSTPGSVAGL